MSGPAYGLPLKIGPHPGSLSDHSARLWKTIFQLEFSDIFVSYGRIAFQNPKNSISSLGSLTSTLQVRQALRIVVIFR